MCSLSVTVRRRTHVPTPPAWQQHSSASNDRGLVKKVRPKLPENSFPCENEIRRVFAFCCAAFGTFRVRVLHFFRSSDLLEQFRYAYTQTNTSTHAVTHRLTVLLYVCCFQIYYSLGRFFFAGCWGGCGGVVWVARGEGWMDFCNTVNANMYRALALRTSTTSVAVNVRHRWYVFRFAFRRMIM